MSREALEHHVYIVECRDGTLYLPTGDLSSGSKPITKEKGPNTPGDAALSVWSTGKALKARVLPCGGNTRSKLNPGKPNSG